MLESLADFLTEAEDCRELTRWSEPVSAELETSWITRQFIKPGQNSPILFFEEIKGCEFPLVCNLFGSLNRVAKAARSTDPHDSFARIISYFQPQHSHGWLELIQNLTHSSYAKSASRIQIKQGSCQQVLRLGRDVNLKLLPATRHAQEETLTVISRAIVMLQSADQSLKCSQSLSVSILDDKHVALHLEEDRELWRLVQLALKQGQQIGVVILLGGDPAWELAHYGRMPHTFDRCLLTSLFRNTPLEFVPCRTLPLNVPADTEIVLEGIIDPRIELVELPGCVLEHGHLSPKCRQPIAQIQAFTHRSNPIFPDKVRGIPWGEDYWQLKFWEKLMCQFIKLIHPEIRDIHFPPAGIPDQLLFVSLEKRKPYHARQIINLIWSWEFPVVPRTIIIVDADVIVQDEETVWRTLLQHVDFNRDLVIQPASAELTQAVPSGTPATSRLGIDATRKWPSEGYPGTWPLRPTFPVELVQHLEQLLSNK